MRKVTHSESAATAFRSGGMAAIHPIEPIPAGIANGRCGATRAICRLQGERTFTAAWAIIGLDPDATQTDDLHERITRWP
jgi:hypothetical protein